MSKTCDRPSVDVPVPEVVVEMRPEDKMPMGHWLGPLFIVAVFFMAALLLWGMV